MVSYGLLMCPADIFLHGWKPGRIITAMNTYMSSGLARRCFVLMAASAIALTHLPALENYTEDPGTAGDGDHVIGPDFPVDEALTDLGNPKGRQFEFSMPLSESRIFRGDDVTLEPERKPVRKERKVFVYVPHAYRNGDEAPILVIHDGPGVLPLVKNALDNLTRPAAADPERIIPAFIAIAVQNGGSDSKGSQRGLEYDTMSDRLARFIELEVLPAVLANPEIRAAYPDIAFTDNPWGKGVMGCSSGGAAALTMGWFRPDLFRRIKIGRAHV